MSKKVISNAMMAVMALVMIFSLAACGAKPDTADNIPVYPGATVLKPGDDPIADTLAKNMEQDASLRAGMNLGGKIEQRSFKLPADASWDAVKKYYDEQLLAAGWKSGTGGIGGDIAQQALEAANGASDMMKMTMYSKGKQTLTIFRLMADPTATQPYLIFSLNSN